VAWQGSQLKLTDVMGGEYEHLPDVLENTFSQKKHQTEMDKGE
jgi:hypothetical protein